MVSEEEKIISVVITVIIAVAVIYLELRLRRIGIGKKVTNARLNKDHAFNALHTTKAVRNKLKIDRVNTIKADYMVQRAQDCFDDHDYEACTDLCKQAREELLRSKREGNIVAEPAAEPKSYPETAVQNEPAKTSAAGVDNTAQLQAKFELKAAKTDLGAFVGDAGVKNRASQLVEEADRNFNASDYKKSLSCSFRARKLLSGESLEDKPSMKDTERIGKTDGLSPKPSGNRCESCGAENEPEDAFCHSCGKQLKLSKCPSCGADLKGYEKFCRKCGKPTQ